MIAGAIAGIMEHCVMYPLDSVKVSETIRQPDNSSATDGPKDKKCHWPVLRLSRPQVQLVTSEWIFQTRMQSLVTSGREGISETLLRMIRHEGMLRPVRGMSAMVVGAGPSHALYFSSYEYLKNTLVKYSSSEKYHTAVYGKMLHSLSSVVHWNFRICLTSHEKSPQDNHNHILVLSQQILFCLCACHNVISCVANYFNSPSVKN